MNPEFELSLSSLPWKVYRGYRLPFSRSNAAFREYFSVGIGGFQFLYSSVADLLLDIHFRAGTGVLEFLEQSPGGQLPKYRVSICRLWTLEEFEKFFIVKYTDSFEEACRMVRTFETTSTAQVVPQGFGIHRFDPQTGQYAHDDPTRNAVQEAIDQPAVEPAERKPVFISCNSEDYGAAEKIYQLLSRLARPAFFAQKTLRERGNTNFSVEIDRALDESGSLIIVASQPGRFDSPWFDQEWRTWINEYRSGRKSGNVMTVRGDGFSIGELPIALRGFESRTMTSLSDGDITAYF